MIQRAVQQTIGLSIRKGKFRQILKEDKSPFFNNPKKKGKKKEEHMITNLHDLLLSSDIIHVLNLRRSTRMLAAKSNEFNISITERHINCF